MRTVNVKQADKSCKTCLADMSMLVTCITNDRVIALAPGSPVMCCSCGTMHVMDFSGNFIPLTPEAEYQLCITQPALAAQIALARQAITKITKYQ